MAGKGYDYTEKDLRDVWDAVVANGMNVSKAATALDMPRSTIQNRLREFRRRYKPQTQEAQTAKNEFTVMALPNDDLDIEELVELRIKQFGKRREFEEASKLIQVKVRLDGPIGILHFGDPHVDDDGTDLDLLRQHSDLTKIEGVWGANVGDTTNNWIGRLARLYASQSTTAEQAWKLAEWFINRTRWIYMVGGNHDAWAGAADPIKWIARQSDTLYKPSECWRRRSRSVSEMDADAIAAMDSSQAAAVRSDRDRRLAECDWMVIKAYETNSNVPAVWEIYRQALRDIPAQAGFPWDVTWPEKP